MLGQMLEIYGLAPNNIKKGANHLGLSHLGSSHFGSSHFGSRHFGRRRSLSLGRPPARAAPRRTKTKYLKLSRRKWSKHRVFHLYGPACLVIAPMEP